MLHRDHLVSQARRKLNTQVYAYFRITSAERHLIEDTVAIFRPSAQPSTADSKALITAQASSPIHRAQYAKELVSTFKAWTRTSETLWATATLAPASGLALLTFGVGGKQKSYTETTAEKRIEQLLPELRDSVSCDDGMLFRSMRRFAFYEGTKVHLLKPLNRRYWTRTAAQNDADSIINHMQEEDGWQA